MNEPKKPLILSVEERRTQLWGRLMEHWADQLDSLQKQNEADLPEAKTANIRGRIAVVKSCMALGKD